MKNCNESLNHNEPPELDLPDWSGMDDSTTRVQPESAFRLSEEYRRAFPDLPEQWRVQRPDKCLVEFVL